LTSFFPADRSYSRTRFSDASIGNGPFADCKILQIVNLPPTVKEGGVQLFAWCNLSQVPVGILRVRFAFVGWFCDAVQARVNRRRGIPKLPIAGSVSDCRIGSDSELRSAVLMHRWNVTSWLRAWAKFLSINGMAISRQRMNFG
jgi:hypothetical protein